MLKKRIIPCLDINKGRVVKGINFKNLVDAGDPVEQAKIYENEGADEICFLDITASEEKRKTILNLVTKVSLNCSIPLTVGGGVRSIEDIRKLLLSGADKVSINTAAVHNQNFIKESSKAFGSQCIVVAIDAKKISNTNWKVCTFGGKKKTNIDVIKYAEIAERCGAGEILLTSIDRDGTKVGYDLDLLKVICQKVKIPVIASGGAGNLDHLFLAFKKAKVDAVLAASIFHFGYFSVNDAKIFLKKKGIFLYL